MKQIRRSAATLAALTSVLALGACATDGYSTGYFGAGYGGYADPYFWDDGYGYADGYGYGYGWRDGFYYPGSGVYLYDRGGARHRWNSRQRQYWLGQRSGAPGASRWAYGRPDGATRGFAGRRGDGGAGPGFGRGGGQVGVDSAPSRSGARGPLGGGSNLRRR